MMQLMSIKKRPVFDNRGFTLIEAMIGLLIFTFGVLATVSMQTHSMNSNLEAEQTTEAASIGVSVLETLSTLDYNNDAELTDGLHNFSTPELPRYAAQYAVTYTVQRNGIFDDTMLIQISVAWQVKGQNKSVNIVAIKPDIV